MVSDQIAFGLVVGMETITLLLIDQPDLELHLRQHRRYWPLPSFAKPQAIASLSVFGAQPVIVLLGSIYHARQLDVAGHVRRVPMRARHPRLPQLSLQVQLAHPA